MLGAGVFVWSGVVVVCVAFGFICFVLFLFLFFSFFFFSLGIKGGLKLFLVVVQWVGSLGGLSRRLCPYNLTVTQAQTPDWERAGSDSTQHLSVLFDGAF